MSLYFLTCNGLKIEHHLHRLNLNESLNKENMRMLLDASAIKRSKVRPFSFQVQQNSSLPFNETTTGIMISLLLHSGWKMLIYNNMNNNNSNEYQYHIFFILGNIKIRLKSPSVKLLLICFPPMGSPSNNIPDQPTRLHFYR